MSNRFLIEDSFLGVDVHHRKKSFGDAPHLYFSGSSASISEGIVASIITRLPSAR